MKKTAAILAAALTLMSCAPKNQFVIKGTVEKPELEDARVFLVPIGNETPEFIDSTQIKNGRFTFKGNTETLSEIRVERLKRFGTESLLVVTEPGTIEVSLGYFSSGKGTPQNDSLQAWKGANMIYRSGQMSREQLKERTYAIIDALGEDSTLGAFLSKLYPRN